MRDWTAFPYPPHARRRPGCWCVDANMRELRDRPERQRQPEQPHEDRDREDDHHRRKCKIVQLAHVARGIGAYEHEHCARADERREHRRPHAMHVAKPILVREKHKAAADCDEDQSGPEILRRTDAHHPPLWPWEGLLNPAGYSPSGRCRGSAPPPVSRERPTPPRSKGWYPRRRRRSAP